MGDMHRRRRSAYGSESAHRNNMNETEMSFGTEQASATCGTLVVRLDESEQPPDDDGGGDSGNGGNGNTGGRTGGDDSGGGTNRGGRTGGDNTGGGGGRDSGGGSGGNGRNGRNRRGGGGGGNNQPAPQPPQQPPATGSPARVPEGIPGLGGRRYTDPTVLATGFGVIAAGAFLRGRGN